MASEKKHFTEAAQQVIMISDRRKINPTDEKMDMGTGSQKKVNKKHQMMSTVVIAAAVQSSVQEAAEPQEKTESNQHDVSREAEKKCSRKSDTPDIKEMMVQNIKRANQEMSSEAIQETTIEDEKTAIKNAIGDLKAYKELWNSESRKTSQLIKGRQPEKIKLQEAHRRLERIEKNILSINEMLKQKESMGVQVPKAIVSKHYHEQYLGYCKRIQMKIDEIEAAGKETSVKQELMH
jgi:hypothetical protein